MGGRAREGSHEERPGTDRHVFAGGRLDLLADDKTREDLEWLADLLTVSKDGEIVLAVKQTEGQAAEDVKDAIMDTMEDNLELLGLLALLLQLIPLCFIFFVCCVYSGHTQLWRRWFFSHSNPYVVKGYMPKDARTEMRAELNRVKTARFSGRQPEQPLGYQPPYPERASEKKKDETPVKEGGRTAGEAGPSTDPPPETPGTAPGMRV